MEKKIHPANNIGNSSIRNLNAPTTMATRMTMESTHILKPMGTRTVRLTRILMLMSTRMIMSIVAA